MNLFKNLYLLKCKSDYKLKDETFILKGYENCDTCSEYSENINSQKCLICKSGYFFDNNNCIFMTKYNHNFYLF